MELVQNGAVLVGTWWYWVTLYCFVLRGIGLEKDLKVEIAQSDPI